MAVKKVRSKEMTLGHAAVVYDVPKTTLFRRMRKDGHLDEVTRKGLGRFRPVFTQKQENELAYYLIFMENRIFGAYINRFQAPILPVCC